MLKDWRKIHRKLRRLPGVSEKERILIARGLAATPRERMEMHDQCLRSLGLYSYWDRKKFGFKLQE